MIPSNAVIGRGTNQSSVEMEGETVILDLSTGTYFGLKEVGTRIWQIIETPTEFSRICETICAEYEVEEATVHADVQRLLTDLADRSLVTVQA